MQIRDFAYHRPRSVSEACKLARELGREAVFLAGGTELIPDYKRGAERAAHLIALRDIPDLAAIRVDEGRALRIGGMARLADVAASPAIRSAFPVLAEAAAQIGGSQIRHQGTIGGNFCRAVPCADTPPPCIVGDAEVRLIAGGGDDRGGDGDDERRLPAAEFFTGPRQTARRPHEILVEIVVPRQPDRSGASYQRFALRRGSALAVASVAARLVLDGDGGDGGDSDMIRDARVALGAVAPVPLRVRECERMLAGERVSAALFAGAARAAAAAAQPIDDIRGSAAYRRQLVEVLTMRALAEAAARARARTRRGDDA